MHTLSRIVCLVAATTGLSASALAGTVTFDSNTASTSYLGYSATSSAPATGAPQATYVVDPGTVWSQPLGSSQWISYHENTGPGSAFAGSGDLEHAPDGYYTYATSFIADAGSSGSVTVMADDTVAVYLNGIQILAAAPGPYQPVCANGLPTCTAPDTVALTNLLGGTNELKFVVTQGGDFATGLDFTGVAMTPEPSSLLLLGTGLVGSAGAVLRRFRRA